MLRQTRSSELIGALGWFLLSACLAWVVMTYLRNPSFFTPQVETGDWHAILDEPGSRNVLVYSLSTCPACRETKALLDRHCVGYLDRDVGTPGSSRRQFEILKGQSVPVIVIGNRKITGYHPDEILDALDAAGIAAGEPGRCSTAARTQRPSTAEPRTS
jgi:glutaredoxin 3